MAILRLFGPARDAAACSKVADVPGQNVGEVLDAACADLGEEFAKVLAISAVWLNGEPTERGRPVGPDDEIAVLPPVSGG